MEFVFINIHYLSLLNNKIQIMNPVKILLISFFSLIYIGTNAQTPSLTFLGGANAASMSVKLGSSNPENEKSYKMLFGLNIGAMYDYVFSKDRRKELSVTTGLMFDSRGYSQNLDNEGLKLDNKTTLYYIDVPIYLKYKYRFRSRNKVYFGAGPYLGVGLFGNSYVEYQYAGAEPGSSSETISWGNDPLKDNYKRLDYGLSAKVGFLWDGGFTISASYDYGLPNISAVDTREDRNRLIRLSVGYTLDID